MCVCEGEEGGVGERQDVYNPDPSSAFSHNTHANTLPTHTHTHAYKQTPYTHTHTFKHTPTHTHTYKHTPTHTHTYLQTHIPTNTYKHTPTYKHVQPWLNQDAIPRAVPIVPDMCVCVCGHVTRNTVFDCISTSCSSKPQFASLS